HCPLCTPLCTPPPHMSARPNHCPSRPFFLSCSPDHPHLPSFPTRRSSDLYAQLKLESAPDPVAEPGEVLIDVSCCGVNFADCITDRKSTRLNSSHVKISYAVFCLKKKIEVNVDNISH